ncbi:MAG: uroporphyrinogen decarboxylase family protein [Armatimonadota bacterium]
MTSRERFLAAIAGQPVDRTPVFPLLMFLPADRAGLTYREFAANGQALAEAQLGVQRRFGVDAITACSDAFRISADLGGEMAFPEDGPPHLQRPLVTTAGDLAGLGRPDPTVGRMGDRVDAVAAMVRAAGEEVAVLGWVDMPFAEACSVCGVSDFMTLMYDEPEIAHRLLETLTEIVIDFALAQVEAGAVMIGAGDAAASLVSPPMYAEFALPYEQRVIAAIHARQCLVKLHICGDTTALLAGMVTSGADLFNVDHLVSLERARAVYGAHEKCFKGNLDPVADIMQSTPEACRARVHHCLEITRGARYMVSAGCEVPAGTPDEVFQAFCSAAGEYTMATG